MGNTETGGKHLHERWQSGPMRKSTQPHLAKLDAFSVWENLANRKLTLYHAG